MMTWLEIVKTVGTIALLVAVCIYAWATILNGRTFKIMTAAFNDMIRAFNGQANTLADVHSWTVPPEQWAGVVELHRQMTDMGSELGDYLIYCHNHSGYWAATNQGYTPIRDEARRFSAAEGLILVLDRARNSDPFDCYVLIRVGKPEQGSAELDAVTESAECPYCGNTFYAPLHHDPLKKHFDYCPERPNAEN